MKIDNINKYLKTIENNNIILIFYNNMLSIIINKNTCTIYAPAGELNKNSIKEYINQLEGYKIQWINDINYISNNIYIKL